MKTKILSALTLVMVFSMIASTVLAAPAPPAAQTSGSAPVANPSNLFQAADAAGPALYIVQLQDAPLASYYGGIESFAPTSPRVTGERKLNMDSAASRAYMDYLDGVQAAMLSTIDQALGRAVRVHAQWNVAYNGFAIEIEPEEAAAVAKLDGVQFVQREFMRYPQTDVGPQWIGADNIWSGAATGTAYKGEGVVAGIIDTGINLGHPSFADVGGDGYNHTNPLGSGNYLGLCASNPGTYVCNDKTYGFYIYTGEVTEDGDGHGSHTGSTTAGNYLAAGTVDLTPFNSYSPAISGVAPHANVIGYKSCLDAGGCPGAALVSAINQATADGVDVINYSIGGGTSNPWTDADALAFLAAQDAGVVPVTSAGNSGPAPSTLGSPGDAPWMLTVGASTHNRAGLNAVINMTGGSTTPPGTLNGKGFALGYGPASIVYAGNYGDALCLNPFAPGTFSGQIVVCDRGTNARVAKGYNVLQGGAGGMVLANANPGDSMNGDVHWLPAVQINAADGVTLKTWLASGSGHTATIAGTTISTAPANGDIMAGFSSRGPLVNNASDVIKPDVTAPGVDVLAAYRDLPPGPEDPTRNYGIVSGTSMSSPHTAGTAALLSGLYPDWTPAEIKAALMSTGKSAGVLKEDGVTQADPFDMGAGRVQVDQAAQAGLLFDVPAGAFQAANPGTGGDPKSLNLASLGNDDCGGLCTWTRTVEATAANTWNASVTAPAGMTITVTPSNFTLAAGGTQVLTIEADVSGLPLNQWAFGAVTLTPATAEGSTLVAPTRLPLAVKPTQNIPDVNITPTSLAATQAPDTTTSQALTIGNVGTGSLIWQIDEAPLAMGIEFTAEGMDAPEAPISLIVDDGVGENAIGLTNGGQFLWLNRFTPGAGNFPLQLQQVDIMFGYPAGGSGGVNVGELVDIYLYEDADGNPANGATFVSSLLNQAVEAVDGVTFSTYPLPAPVTFNGPGDVLIAVVNRTAGVAAGTFPAALDQTVSQGRSWIGLGTGATTNPPTIPPATFGTVDSFGFPGNMMVRGYGEAAAACDNPADVPWLSVTPTGGTTPAGGSTGLTVGFDSTGLAVGAYNAVLCVNSNDPDTPLVEVPVELTVEEQAGNVVTICSMPNVPIPDNTTAGPGSVSDTISVAADLTIVDFNVYVNATHTWVGDLAFSLTNVSTATTVGLINRPGVPASTFGCSGDNYDVWVDDEGTDTPIENQCGAAAPAITGRAIGGDPPNASLLTAFDGQSTLGDWTLTVTDNETGDTGTLVEWCVEVTVPTAGPPNIDVDPLSLASTQPANTSTTQSLGISNTGGEDLLWEIFEDASGAAPELVDWSDNFDSYATGSQLHGQGGWKGWGNDPTFGAFTTNAQFRSSPNSAAIEGASDLVHEYTETDGQWVYTAWQYVPTNFTGQSYFILLNTYDDAGATNNWSTQVMFDGGTNLVTNDGGVSGGSAALVKGQWVELRVEIDLDADTGAFYYNNQLLYSGTWSGQVSGAGATSIGAVDLFANGASAVYYDDMSLVNVSGAVACDAPEDIPWASVNPTLGTTTPSATTNVDVTFDSTGLPLGTYTGNLCVESNDPDAGPGNGTDLVIVPLRLVVEEDVPNIDVNPLSLASTQATNTSTQQMLTVANTGGGTLTWQIDEENLPVIEMGPLTLQPATEDVGAPEGAAPAAAPSPSALWQAPDAILYDNGPQVTHPGGGLGGADASALQTALGLSTYGFGHAVSSGFRVADDFTVPAGGWQIDQITFFAYQTGSSTTSTINAVNLRIWDGPPGQPGSNIVFGDTTTNRLASSTFSNIYRVLDTALTNNQRPVMANVAAVGTFLPAGTYWLDWQTGGTLTSGPWAHPVSLLGQLAKPGANGLQFDPTAGTWNPLLDTGAQAVQDLPFVIEGAAGEPACVSISDIPWLSLSASAGSNAGGTSSDITVTFDSTGLPNGTYTGNLCATSNDPDAGPGNGTDLVIVPVELTVQPPTAVTLDSLAASNSAVPAPAGLPLGALPAVAAAAFAAVYALRRRR